MFQSVNRHRRLAGCGAFDVDLLDNRLQHLLFARLGDGDQLAFVRAGGQFGGGDG
jgi:hypothetical protein